MIHHRVHNLDTGEDQDVSAEDLLASAVPPSPDMEWGGAEHNLRQLLCVLIDKTGTAYEVAALGARYTTPVGYRGPRNG